MWYLVGGGVVVPGGVWYMVHGAWGVPAPCTTSPGTTSPGTTGLGTTGLGTTDLGTTGLGTTGLGTTGLGTTGLGTTGLGTTGLGTSPSHGPGTFRSRQRAMASPKHWGDGQASVAPVGRWPALARSLCA